MSQEKNRNRIAELVSIAVMRGNGVAVADISKTIGDEFILLRKSDLPAVAPTKLAWSDKPALKARTAGYNGRKPEIYWDRALDFIAVALYAEQEEGNQAKRVLAGKRSEAFSMLHPSMPPLGDYDGLTPEAKKQVDVVVNLMTQVDELKEAK